MGFKGILMSDDISMKALKYDLVTNALKSINADVICFILCRKHKRQLKID